MNAERNLKQILLLCCSVLQVLASRAQPVTNIATGSGSYHSFFLKSDGSLWAMGYNGSGQLGDGTFGGVLGYTNRPEQIVTSNVTAIAAGDSHSLFLKGDGSLWAMGANHTLFYNDGHFSAAQTGQLGDGTYNDTNRPEQIVVSNVTAIAAGSRHSLFLKNDGSLWAMGCNREGELGDGTYANYGNPALGFTYGTNSPEQIVDSGVTAIAAGYFHSLFLKSDGSLWAMGANIFGQLGDGTNNPTNQPEQIVSSNVTAIAAGGSFSLFIKNDGSLWAMGWNYFGQLGDGTTNNATLPEQVVASNVTAIAAGYGFSLFLKSDGSLWAMGHNIYGQLGDGTTNQTNRPEQIVTANVTMIAAGFDHSLFLKADGSLWAMGNNVLGELGYGIISQTNRPVQILAPYNQISSLLQNGTNVQLSFVGAANANYALDRSSSLSLPTWIPQATNTAGSFGALVFTNAPDATTNNFWRIRSVP
jgi:alpha-tubulin suppressor-like RCC1 family protein